MEDHIIKFTTNQKPLTTSISNIFIDEYLSVAHPTFILVYIFFYRHSIDVKEEMTIKLASDILKVLESDIIKAFKYWQDECLINLIIEDDNVSLEFLEVVSKLEVPKEIEVEVKKVATEEVKTYKPIIMETRPQYSVQELEIYKIQSTEIQKLFSVAEQTLGKLLNYNDLSVLFSLYDWLRLPVEVIEILLVYCEENNHRNMRYIEKAAIDWAENEINTVSKARDYIKLFSTDYREILKAFGQGSRNPTTSEIRYMKKWLHEYIMPIEIILEACDKTMMQIGQPKFSYADTILEKWNKDDMKTLEKIKISEEQFYKNKEVKASTKKVSESKPNRFSNFKQREWDFDELEKLERKYLENELKNN
jgi:DnaD/phage-associated family protein